MVCLDAGVFGVSHQQWCFRATLEQTKWGFKWHFFLCHTVLFCFKNTVWDTISSDNHQQRTVGLRWLRLEHVDLMLIPSVLT
jgi:hypothetical protein